MRVNRRNITLSLLAPLALLVAGNHAPASLPAGPTPQNFTLGVITTRVSLPGNLYDKAMSQLDPTKGNIQEQVQRIIGGMSVAEQQQAQAQMQQNPGMSMMALMLPRKATIYVRGQEARATTDALTYHLENYFNGAQNAGLCLIKSQSTPQQVAFRYTGSKRKQEWQTISISDADYTVQPTSETALIAGYPCVKTKYTLKATAHPAPAPDPGASQLKMQAVALDVWTSSKMPASLNFAHPIYINEKQGIMKIVVYFDKSHKQQLLYEFTSVHTKPVTPQDLHIATTDAVMDYDKEGPAIGLKLLGLMMGAPQAPGRPDEDK
jgi:hypothetical protein